MSEVTIPMSLEQIQEQMKLHESLIEEERQKELKISDKRETYNAAYQNLKIQYVLQSGILKEATWEIHRLIHRSHNSVEFYLHGNDKKFKNLCKMLQHDYHCRLDLEPGVDLRFNDWDIDLLFPNADRAMEFVKKYGLKLNLDFFQKEMDMSP